MATASLQSFMKGMFFVTHDHESDSALYSLNRKTGETIWKVDRTGSKPSASTPTIYQTKQGKALVVSTSQSHGCYAVDIESGKISWETGPGSLDKRSVSSPTSPADIFLHPVAQVVGVVAF